MFHIEIKNWSATDFAYLVNNDLGWVSDDQKFYCFDCETKYLQFLKYLGDQ